jgi:ABC-type Na+ efflux pump permease subunit
MTFLPIVERELRVAARRKATHWIRLGMAAAALVLASFTFLIYSSGSFVTGLAGNVVFSTLAGLSMFYCAIEGVRQTCDCLSGERREGTLGLLFLTDLRGFDVVFGKLAATGLTGLYGLLATAPVLALPLLMGGITAGEYWRAVLALLNALFFSLAVGMWVSARSREEARALFGALGIMGVLCVLLPSFEQATTGNPAGGWTGLFSPLGPLLTSYAGAYLSNPAVYWTGLGLSQAVAWGLLLLACRRLQRHWREDAGAQVRSESRLQRWLRGSPARRTLARREWLDVNPALWLSVRRSVARRWYVLAVALLVGLVAGELTWNLDWQSLSVTYNAIMGWIFFFVKLFAAWAGCRVVVEARRSGALELLLTTPLTAAQIVDGQWRGLARFWWAVVYLSVALPVLLLTTMWFDETGVREAPWLMFGLTGINVSEEFAWSKILVPVLGQSLVCVADVYALFWTGMWFGLCARGLANAFFRTYLLVIFVPWLLLFFAQLAVMFLIFSTGFTDRDLLQVGWLLLVLLKDVAFVKWARRNLRERFREVAALGPGTPQRGG